MYTPSKLDNGAAEKIAAMINSIKFARIFIGDDGEDVETRKYFMAIDYANHIALSYLYGINLSNLDRAIERASNGFMEGKILNELAIILYGNLDHAQEAFNTVAANYMATP